MSRLLWLIMTPLAMAALAAAVWFFGGWQDADRWPIRWLEVEGRLERTTAAQVRAAVAGEARQGYFVVDMQAARAAVEGLPWVAAASVSRQWPDALTILVEEHQPAARWNESALISATGEIFDVAGTSGMQGLTRLTGPDARKNEVYSAWRRIAARMQSAGLGVATLELDARGAWTLTLDEGWELLLGRDEVEDRLERFLSVHARLARVPDIERIDLRYPNGLALTRRTAPADGLAADRKTTSGASQDHG